MPEERRVVTVLFADVTGSTALGEESDPEDVRALMGRYYSAAREVVDAHGGTLEKFIGDAVMAVFGMPQAHGDDAERALAAALALRDALARDELTAALQLRIGVNTGEVVATRERDAGDFLITGDAVNVAARLQQHADPGAILVGERTRVAAAGSFAFGDERAVEVKGKREPLRAAELREPIAGRRAPLAPFVGREGDLAQLALVASRAFNERRPQLVTITAPAGTGKSRLVDEFVARLGATADLTVATAQCLPYGASVTYLPLRGLVRGLLHLDADDDPVEAVRSTFATAGQTAADADRLTSFVGATLGGTAEPEERDREQLFAAWRLLVEALATRGPLVVVFEDLHWASDSLIDLVDHVTLPRTHAPLVMVALARPELLDRRPQWGGGRRNFAAIGLEPLSNDETRRLVELLTEGVPGEMAEGIVERAGGNPFFAGELVRAYEDRKRAGASDEEIVLPDTVHATVLARLDGLPEVERTALEYAAVAGRTARVAAVQSLLPDRPGDEVADALESLAERELLVPSGGDAYTFRHIVIREVAYATLPRARRVQAHLRLATWLEEYGAAHGEEMAELVAYHYRQAIALSPGGKLPEGLTVSKVVAALERAARIAWNGSAYAESVAHIREAIRLSPPEQHMRLLELLGDVMRFGDSAAAGYREAYDLWRATPGGHPRDGARLLVKRFNVEGRWAGSISRQLTEEEVRALEAEASALVARAGEPELEARFACARAFSMRFKPDRAAVERIIPDVREARRFFAVRGDDNMESEALDALGSMYRGLGDWESALAVVRERLTRAERLDLLERLDAWGVLTWDLVYAGRYGEAVHAFEDMSHSRRAGEAESTLNHSAAWATLAAAVSGRWNDALRLADALVLMREEAPTAVARHTIPGWLGGLRVASARLDATRVARYRSTFLSIMDLAALASNHSNRLLTAAIDGDIASGLAFLARPAPSPDRKAEVMSILLLERGVLVPEATLAAIESQTVRLPALLTLRIRLARALHEDSGAALRRAVAELDAGELVADAARAAALLAIKTRDAVDVADAERRLTALGDRQYLQKIAEELGTDR